MKMLDFNALQQPTWSLKLKDENCTVVNLSLPSVELLDRLIAATPELQEVTKTKDGKTIHAVYELIADVMNCNADGFSFTGDELRVKYHLSLLDLFTFVAGYLDFVKEIQEAKN